MAGALNVKLGVDINGLLQGMSRAEKSLGDFKDQAARFKAALDKATDPKTIERLNRAIEASKQKMAAIQAAGTGAGSGLQNLANGGDEATESIQNLGRVVQDAPFGFIGIQNNINPLIDSFQRLRATTGSNRAALTALLDSLMGVGGLGLAVSLATSLLTVLTQNGFFKSEEAANEAAEANKRYKDSLENIFSNAAKEATEVKSLIVVLNSETETRKRKLQALKDLKEINPEIFKDLTLEKGAVEGLDTAYQNYVKNLRVVIAAKIKQAQIEEIMTKILKLQGAEMTNFEKSLLKTNKQIRETINKGQYGVAGFNNTIKEVNDSSELKKLEFKLADLIGQLGELSSGIKIDIDKEKAEKTKKKVETINDVIAELSREIDFLNAKSIAFGTNEAKAKISAIESAAEKLIKDFKVAPDDALINKLFYGTQKGFTGGKILNPIKDFNIPSIKALQQEIQKRIERAAPSMPTEIKVPIIVKPDIKPIDEKEFTKILRALQINEGIQALAKEMQDTIANSFGSAIENAVTGKSAAAIFANFFKTILSSLGDGIKQIGVTTLAAGKAIEALRNLFGTSLGIGASIALIALGGVIKGLANNIKIPGFADGVTNFRGGLAMVGERGPELVRLPSGSDVVPNHSLGALGGGMGMDISGNFRVAGSDLILVLERANRSYNRSA